LVEARNGFVRFGVLGNVHVTKGTWTAATAFCALPPDLRKRSRLYIAGPASATAEARLARLAEQVPQLTYLGQRVDPRQFFNNVDVALVPSQWHEPFGRVAAEAGILGVPVIASRAGGIPEALEQFGGGVLVDDFRRTGAWTEALANAIVAPPPGRSFVPLPRRNPVWLQYAAIYARAVAASGGDETPPDGRT
jgi:glycosyltransferase involved in cell wall biosynthesis